MREDYEIRELNSTYRMAMIVAPVMFVIGCLLLTQVGFKEIFVGIFFIVGSFVLIGVGIARKKELNVKLDRYMEKKLTEYFIAKNGGVKFSVKRKKKIKLSYIIYVNGYVNKSEFELFMLGFKQDLGLKIEHRLLRKPATRIR